MLTVLTHSQQAAFVFVWQVHEARVGPAAPLARGWCAQLAVVVSKRLHAQRAVERGTASAPCGKDPRGRVHAEASYKCGQATAACDPVPQGCAR